MNIQAHSLLNNLDDRSSLQRSNVDGCCLTWRAWGSQNIDRRPVVLLHGGFGAWNHWIRNIPLLEKDFNVLAVDLPGCGDSSDPPKPYTAKSLADIVSSSLDEVVGQDAPFDLIAFSFGGFLSGLIAHSQKRRINSVTLIGSPILGLTGDGPANDLIEVPHPRMHLRNFVLLPLNELNPYWKHPIYEKKIYYFIKSLNLKSRLEITRLKKNAIV